MYKNLTFCAALPCRLRLVEHWLLPVMEREKMLPVLFLLLVFVRFNKSSPIFTQTCYTSDPSTGNAAATSLCTYTHVIQTGNRRVLDSPFSYVMILSFYG